jgi:hypothetical protein
MRRRSLARRALKSVFEQVFRILSSGPDFEYAMVDGNSGSASGMEQPSDNQDEEMKLRIQGLIPPGEQFYRNVLFDKLYASIPRDAEAKVQIYTAEIAPKGWTNFQGLLEIEWANLGGQKR